MTANIRHTAIAALALLPATLMGADITHDDGLQTVTCTTWVEVLSETYDNQARSEVESLGGSAPYEVLFSAEVSDAAIWHQWQVADDEEMSNIIYRCGDLVMDYTFRSEGKYYVRFTASDATGSCDCYGTMYEVTIGNSSLKCPNAFTPFTSPGVNDEWKVSYRSIVEFDCHIFNRWGVEVAHLTQPYQGWDGTHRGKNVPVGVYYYVIKTLGADGRIYNLSGDINIIK